MKATNLRDCAAPLLRTLLPADMRSRRLPLSYTLALYQDTIREQLSIDVFERQFNTLLHLPVDEDPARAALAFKLDRRLVTMNSAYHSSSPLAENHSASEFDGNINSLIINDKRAFMPRYTYYMNDMEANYKRLQKRGIDFYPFQGPDYLGKAFVLLRDIERYQTVLATERDPRRTFNEKTRKFYTTLFNLTGTFLSL